MAPMDLRILGRTFLHAALVGLAAGLAIAGLFVALEYVQHIFLEGMAGYVTLRAHGERIMEARQHTPYRPWVLMVLPGLGGLLCGLVTLLAPEARGGGSNAMIQAFHHKAGVIRKRVVWVKSLASIFTLGSGGAGGREGPTMQIGGALGSLVGSILNVNQRERRILLVAGVGAGMAAVFRAPLGAALLAVEVLYRDGFESDALVPSILASVVAYSVVILIFGESTLFAHAPRFPFIPGHLPIYGLLALFIALIAATFVKTLEGIKRATSKLPIPIWARPAAGGLVLGVFVAPVIYFVGNHIGSPGQGLGILGGGYGAVQMAISGASWLGNGWNAAVMLGLLSIGKLIAASITIGSGGSAGDFAPSLVIGGLFGGAFGRVAQLLLHDPRIDPGAFSLVGMGAFYGGVGHVPLSALVLVCELAGNYDLLVPLMLALAITFVAVRKHTLYSAQLPAQPSSPAHRDALISDLLRTLRVEAIFKRDRPFISFDVRTSVADMLKRVGEGTRQDVFPVVNQAGRGVGMVTIASLHLLSNEHGDAAWMLAADVMGPLVSIKLRDTLHTATDRFVGARVHSLPVIADDGSVLGLLDEIDISAHYLSAAQRADYSGVFTMPPPGAAGVTPPPVNADAFARTQAAAPAPPGGESPAFLGNQPAPGKVEWKK